VELLAVVWAKAERTSVATLATRRNLVRRKRPSGNPQNPEPNVRVFGKTVGATQTRGQSVSQFKKINLPPAGRNIGDRNHP
jgi:hypothetical protein